MMRNLSLGLGVMALLSLSMDVHSAKADQAKDAPALREAQQRPTFRERIQARRDNAAQKSPGQVAVMGGREVSIWAPKDTMPATLIMFSHGFKGCPSQSTFLTQSLSDAGYLVIAPKHADASCRESGDAKPEESFREPDKWSDETYRDRREDMVAVINALRTDTTWSQKIDFSKIGLMGHSLGGYTVLGLGGGWASWRLDGVGAILALSPVCKPFVENGQLQALVAAVSFQGGTRDLGITPSVKRRGGCYDVSRAPSSFIEFDGAGHLAWTDRPSSASENIAFYTITFFDSSLRGSTSADLRQKRPGVSDLRWK